MKAKMFLIVVVLVCTVGFTLVPVHAEIVPYFRWPTRPNLSIYVDSSCSQFKGLIEAGFQMWKAGFTFQYSYTDSMSLHSGWNNKVFFFCNDADAPWAPTMSSDILGAGIAGRSIWSGENGIANYSTTELESTLAIAWLAQHEEGHSAMGIYTNPVQGDLMDEAGGCMFGCRSILPSQADFDYLNQVYDSLPTPEYPTWVISFALITLLALIIVKNKSPSAT